MMSLNIPSETNINQCFLEVEESIPMLRTKKELRALRPAALKLYRDCMKTIQCLEPDHQKTWYDYTRLKYEENAGLTDPKKIRTIISGVYKCLSSVH